VFLRMLFKRPSLIGMMVGMVLMAFSLTPSLIPRTWTVQAVIAALSFLCGYGIGVGLSALWRYLQLPTVPAEYRARISWILLAICALFLLYFVYRSLGWQNNVRQTVGPEPSASVDPLRMVLLAAGLIVFLLLVFRFLGWLAAAIISLAGRFICRRVGRAIGVDSSRVQDWFDSSPGIVFHSLVTLPHSLAPCSSDRVS
jgi:uncharacterized membrane protein